MSEESQFWKDYRAARAAKRADNRHASADLLSRKGVSFEEKNDGAHLIVRSRRGPIDFWPGTGRWICRAGGAGTGVQNLITFIDKQQPG